MTTKRLAAFVSGTDYNDLPQEVRLWAKMSFLDWMGATLAGSREPVATVMFHLLEALNASGPDAHASILGTKARSDVLNAALVNGTFSHALDIDDYHADTLCHPSAAYMSAILAMAEQKSVDGQTLITAVSLAGEVMLRIGYAARRVHYDRGWHATSTLGRFGAAAGAGKVLALDTDQLINAFGLAGTMAGGLRQVFGTMGKPFHAGKAAMDGVQAALLAHQGFQCSKEIIEGPQGFFELFTESPNREALIKELGAHFHLPTLSFKPYPSCAGTHATIDLMRKFRVIIEPDEVESIEIDVGKIVMDAAGKIAPTTGLEGKFSNYYCAAMALYENEIGIEQFSDEKVQSPEIRKLQKKIMINIPKPDLGFEVRGTLRTRDGKEHKATVVAPKGNPKNPMSYEEIVNKFRTVTRSVIPPSNIEKLLSHVERLEEVKNLKNVIECCRC
jgi:2-methylcitrate dehydratase PrpD